MASWICHFQTNQMSIPTAWLNIGPLVNLRCCHEAFQCQGAGVPLVPKVTMGHSRRWPRWPQGARWVTHGFGTGFAFLHLFAKQLNMNDVTSKELHYYSVSMRIHSSASFDPYPPGNGNINFGSSQKLGPALGPAWEILPMEGMACRKGKTQDTHNNYTVCMCTYIYI